LISSTRFQWIRSPWEILSCGAV